MRNATNSCNYRYANLLHYKHRSLKHVSATYCGHLQAGGIWRIYYTICEVLHESFNIFVNLSNTDKIISAERCVCVLCIWRHRPEISETRVCKKYFNIDKWVKICIVACTGNGCRRLGYSYYNKLHICTCTFWLYFSQCITSAWSWIFKI